MTPSKTIDDFMTALEEIDSSLGRWAVRQVFDHHCELEEIEARLRAAISLVESERRKSA